VETLRTIFTGIDVSRVKAVAPLDATPVYLKRLRDTVRASCSTRASSTQEIVRIALEAGADGIVVSNHGGRNEETLRASVDMPARGPRRRPRSDSRVPRRWYSPRHGCVSSAGARRAGVGIGRPQALGLAAFGQPGVEAVLDILNTELTNIMRQAGTARVTDITRSLRGALVAHMIFIRCPAAWVGSQLLDAPFPCLFHEQDFTADPVIARHQAAPEFLVVAIDHLEAEEGFSHGGQLRRAEFGHMAGWRRRDY
jgi:hypothetical protein